MLPAHITSLHRSKKNSDEVPLVQNALSDLFLQGFYISIHKVISLETILDIQHQIPISQ
jgi:hypothetical protein